MRFTRSRLSAAGLIQRKHQPNCIHFMPLTPYAPAASSQLPAPPLECAFWNWATPWILGYPNLNRRLSAACNWCGSRFGRRTHSGSINSNERNKKINVHTRLRLCFRRNADLQTDWCWSFVCAAIGVEMRAKGIRNNCVKITFNLVVTHTRAHTHVARAFWHFAMDENRKWDNNADEMNTHTDTDTRSQLHNGIHNTSWQ